MEHQPKFSIVTPSYNQGSFIGETIESVLSQGYPNLEYIIVDGGSTDETTTILSKYAHIPYIKVISEKDKGQADAINKGFRLATGKVYGILNSDDTYLPGTLHRIAQEINPQEGHHVVMGRCKFIDEKGKDIGIEHPSRFESHQRVLEIWKGHAIPQPATFWTKDVWEKVGEMHFDVFHLDYDLFCRMSSYYRFYTIDQVVATYRLHHNSKTEQWTEEKRLEESISISKKYWGPIYSLKYWQLSWSLFRFRLNRTKLGRNLLKKAQTDIKAKCYLIGLWKAFLGAIIAPEVVFYVVIFPSFKTSGSTLIDKLLTVFARRGDYPQTQAILSHTTTWDDLWVGPLFVNTIPHQNSTSKKTILIKGFADTTYLDIPLVLSISINDSPIAEREISQKGDFELLLDWKTEVEQPITITVKANTYFIPHQFSRNGDYRPLSWKVLAVDLV